MTSASSTVVLITGGNTGVGFETARALLKSSTGTTYTVLLGSRSLERGQSAADALWAEFKGAEVVPIQVDIEDEGSVDEAFAQVSEQFGRVDVLINNAGASWDIMVGRGQMSSRDAWIKSFNLNTLATQFFTASFVPLLLKSSAPRLIFISSFVSSLQLQVDAVLPIDQSPPAGWPKSPMFEAPAYRASKTSLNMVAREWSRILKNDGVVVHIAALSRYATAFGGGDAESKKKTGAPDASVGGEFVRSFVEGERDGDQGKFVSEKGVIPW